MKLAPKTCRECGQNPLYFTIATCAWLLAQATAVLLLVKVLV